MKNGRVVDIRQSIRERIEGAGGGGGGGGGRETEVEIVHTPALDTLSGGDFKELESVGGKPTLGEGGGAGAGAGGGVGGGGGLPGGAMRQVSPRPKGAVGRVGGGGGGGGGRGAREGDNAEGEDGWGRGTALAENVLHGHGWGPRKGRGAPPQGEWSPSAPQRHATPDSNQMSVLKRFQAQAILRPQRPLKGWNFEFAVAPLLHATLMPCFLTPT